jgi:hypothetical protein
LKTLARAALNNALLPKRAAVVALLCLTACATEFHPQKGLVTSSDAAPTADESYLVLGVSTSQYSVIFFKGRDSNGQFIKADGQITFLRGEATDGYVVGKARAGDVVALTGVYRYAGGGLQGKPFDFCGAQVLSLQVPAGKVIYLGELDISSTDHSIDLRHSLDDERARAYVDRAFPKIAGRLERADVKFEHAQCERVGGSSGLRWVVLPKRR